MSEVPIPAPDVLPTHEHLQFAEGLVTLQSRLLLGGEALNPNNRNLPAVNENSFAASRQLRTETTYRYLSNASTSERKNYWERQNIQGFDEQKRVWVDKTVKSFTSLKEYFVQSGWDKALSKLGINTQQFTSESADRLYSQYFEGDKKVSSITKFVSDVVSSYVEDGQVNYGKLKADLPAFQWIGGMFGETSSEVTVQLIDAQVKDMNKDLSQTLIDEVNKPSNDKTKLNDPNQKEIELLDFVWSGRHEEATLPSPSPRPEPTKPTQPKTEAGADISDLEKLKNTFWFNEKMWQNALQIRNIAANSDAVKNGLPVYYPGSGMDIYYPLAFTDADKFVFTDYVYINEDGSVREDYLPTNSIKDIGGTITSVNDEGILGQGGKKIIEFDWNGKRRTVYLYAEDATKFTPLELQAGNAFTIIKAPTPFGRSRDIHDVPGNIWGFETQGNILEQLALGGFLHWVPARYLEPETLGLKKLIDYKKSDDSFYYYKEGYPLYQKIRNEPNAKELLSIDNSLDIATVIRDGVYTLTIDDETLDYFEKELKELRNKYEKLPLDKQKDILLLIDKLFTSETISEEQKNNLIKYGRNYGLADEQKLKEYWGKSIAVAESVFPELKTEEADKEGITLTKEDLEQIPDERMVITHEDNLRAARLFINKLDEARQSAEEFDWDGKKMKKDKYGFVSDERGWYNVADARKIAQDRYGLPLAIDHSGNHAKLILKIFKDSNNQWKEIYWNPWHSGEKEEKLNPPVQVRILPNLGELEEKIRISGGEPDEIDKEITKFLEANHLSIDNSILRDVISNKGTNYDLTLGSDRELTDETIAAKLGYLQPATDAQHCVVYSFFNGVMRAAAKWPQGKCPPQFRDFQNRGKKQFEEDFGIPIATREQLLA